MDMLLDEGVHEALDMVVEYWILEFGDATEMVVANTFFKKRDGRLMTYQSSSQQNCHGMRIQ